MRILHTSDWHLGQTLHNFDRTYEHQCFLDWLLEAIEMERADALLIAGDIFDNANPSASAQRQFYRFLRQAKARVPHLAIVVTAGNHDSPVRLEAPRPLLEDLGITVVGHIRRLPCGEVDYEHLVVPLKNGDGDTAAWCLPVPFLRPGDVPRVETDGDPYMEGIVTLYRRAFDHALGLREPGQAIVALGHCHMVGGEVSEHSERRIVIGGTEALSAEVFDAAVAYAALGHLHKAQRVGGMNHLRYCGSPLPMSFAEIDYAHQIIRVELDGETARSITEVRVPRPVELLRVPPQAAPLDEVLELLAELKLPETSEMHALPYLEVRVRLERPEPGLRARIEAALEGKPVRLAKIETSAARHASGQATPVSLDELERLQPDDIFRRLYRCRYDCDAPAEQLAAFAELLLQSAEKPA